MGDPLVELLKLQNFSMACRLNPTFDVGGYSMSGRKGRSVRITHERFPRQIACMRHVIQETHARITP